MDLEKFFIPEGRTKITFESVGTWQYAIYVIGCITLIIGIFNYIIFPLMKIIFDYI